MIPQAEDGVGVILCLYTESGLRDTLPISFLQSTLYVLLNLSAASDAIIHFVLEIISSLGLPNPPFTPPTVPLHDLPILFYALPISLSFPGDLFFLFLPSILLPVSASIFCSRPTALPPLQAYLFIHTRSWRPLPVLLLYILWISWNFNRAKSTAPNFVWPKIRTSSCLRTCSGVSHRGSILVFVQCLYGYAPCNLPILFQLPSYSFPFWFLWAALLRTSQMASCLPHTH